MQACIEFNSSKPTSPEILKALTIILNPRKIKGIGKRLLICVLIFFSFSNNIEAQATTEFFEDETDGSLTFSNSGKFFDLTNNFHITYYEGEGYGPSDQFIDNYNNCLTAAGIIGSIKPKASGYMKVSSLWLFSSANCASVSNNGTATITGKKSGVTQYTIALTSADLNNSQGVDNGFKLMTFSNYASANTKDVDQLEFAVGGFLRYLAIDNFSYTYVPVTDASAVTFSNTLSTGTNISWTNGTGTSRVVFMKATSTGFPSPVNNSTYTANSVFSSGTQIGGTQWYCVYKGTGTGVTVTGLAPNTSYRIMVVESNGSLGSEKYTAGTTATNNPNNVTTTGTLPVNLLGFMAAQTSDYIEMRWQTSSEINLRKFEIETGVTGSSFTKLGEIPSRNNSNLTRQYTFIDKHPVTGTNLYRIKMIDKDGNFKYSNVALVQFSSTKEYINVIPNPVLNQVMNLGIINLLAGKYDIIISSTTGQILLKQSFQTPGGINNQQLALPFMGKGIYFVQVRNFSKVFNTKLLIQ